MKRTRASLKKYVESSDSEDQRPLKKSPPAEGRNINPDDSSSESDIEAYLHKPEKLDLDSEFFQTKTTKEFEQIERNIFAGVRRLSDSESDTENQTKPNLEKLLSEDHGGTSNMPDEHESGLPSKHTFNQLQDYTKKIEEAKRHVEIYKAKKRAQENKMDISNLLATGEGKTGLEHTITPADLHSSDFESCDSEQEDWEEIKGKASQDKQDSSIVPTKGLQITVDMPDTVRKKKGVDLVAALKRRLNRIRKENQVLVHRVHLLCWIAHGNYVNAAINNSETMAMALSLIPSEQSFPSNRTDLSYLEQITSWYKRTIKDIDKVVPENMSLDECLQHQINKKEAYNKKMLAIIFVVILRALGIQARIVMSLQVEPLRPPASDLHSLSTNGNKGKIHANTTPKGKQQAGSSKLNHSLKKVTTKALSSSSNVSKSGKGSIVKHQVIKQKNPSANKITNAGVKISIQAPSPETNQRRGSKKPTTSKVANATQSQSRSRETSPNLNTAEDPIARKRAKSTESTTSVQSRGSTRSTQAKKSKDNKQSGSGLKVPRLRNRTNSTESKKMDSIISGKKGRSKSANTRKNSKSDKKANDKSEIEIPKTKRRAKSANSVDSTERSQKTKGQRSKGPTTRSVSQPELKPDNPNTRKRAKSNESVDSIQTNKGRQQSKRNAPPGTKNDVDVLEGNPRTRKRAKSTSESMDSVLSAESNSDRKYKATQSRKPNKASTQAKQSELQPDNSNTSRRAKSTESLTDSMPSNSGRQRVKRSKTPVRENEAPLPAQSPIARKRTKSAESTSSIQSGGSTRSTQVKKSKDKKQSESSLNVPRLRNLTNSAESIESNKSAGSVSSENVKKSPRLAKSSMKKHIIPQVGGIYDSDSDVEMDIILQLDGANDQAPSKGKAKPNLKTLKNTTAPKNTRPNLKTLAKKKTDEQSDSESEFEPPGGSPFKKRLESAAPDLSKLKNIKRQNTKQVDVTQDIVKLVKKRMSEQKRIERSRLVKKRKPDPDSDSDSDYAPEPIKKKHHESEDDFLPKTKVKRRVQVRPVLSDSETEKKKKKGNDVWVEVFLEAEEKWISVDVVFGQVHCVKEIAQRASHPIAYVLAWDNNNNVKDITQRYCPNFNTITRKLRTGQKWWNDSLKPFMGLPTPRDKEEDDDLARQQSDQPLPKAISEYKDHPLYVLRRHLLKFEAIYPPEPATLGFIRSEAVYPRNCVYTLHSRDIWLKQAKVVRLGEQPYKIVKARPKWDKLSNKVITDQLLEVFGPWQVEDYEPPTAENGVVPRNAFGNVDLFKSSMLPKGCVHLKLPGLNKIARRMNIDCASAIVGFDFHGGWSHPLYDGFVVCKEYEDQLICAWELEQDELDRKEQEKIDKRVYGNWKKLIRGLLIRERLKAKYDFGAPSASTSKEKKAKGPTLSTKKR